MGRENTTTARRQSDGTLVEVLPDGTTKPLADKTDWQRLRSMSEADVEAAALSENAVELLMLGRVDLVDAAGDGGDCAGLEGGGVAFAVDAARHARGDDVAYHQAENTDSEQAEENGADEECIRGSKARHVLQLTGQSNSGQASRRICVERCRRAAHTVGDATSSFGGKCVHAMST